MFLALFNKHNADFARKVGYNRAKGTLSKYNTIRNHIADYIRKEFHRDDVYLKELNLAFINGFEHYLRSVRDCSTNTIWLYMIGMKHIVSIVRNSGQLAINPFAGYLISPEQKDRGFLNNEELQLLINAKTKNKQQELVRDLFVFSAFTGLCYSDTKNLTKDNLQTTFDGHLWIITRRQKTNTDSSIRLLEVPKKIIEKYKGFSRDNKLFPYAEQFNLQQSSKKHCHRLRNQNASYLPRCKVYFRNTFNSVTGISDRNSQQNDGAYKYQNYPNLCPNYQREDFAGYGNPIPQTGGVGTADNGENIKMESGLSILSALLIFNTVRLLLFYLSISVIPGNKKHIATVAYINNYFYLCSLMQIKENGKG